MRRIALPLLPGAGFLVATTGATRPRRIVRLTLVLLTLTGCATSGPVQEGERGYRWTATKTILNENIQPVIGTFFSRACPRTNDGKASCEKAAVYMNPPGEEVYSYVFKVKIKNGFGVTYGEMANLMYVVGDRANCLQVSEGHNHRPDGRINEGNMRLSADPTERCVGPVFLR